MLHPVKRDLFQLQNPVDLNPLSTNPTKWSNTFKQFVGNLPTNCLSVFDHFMNLALKGLNYFNDNKWHKHKNLIREW